MPNLWDDTDMYYNTLHYTILHCTALKGMSENNVKLPSRYLIFLQDSSCFTPAVSGPLCFEPWAPLRISPVCVMYKTLHWPHTSQLFSVPKSFFILRFKMQFSQLSYVLLLFVYLSVTVVKSASTHAEYSLPFIEYTVREATLQKKWKKDEGFFFKCPLI